MHNKVAVLTVASVDLAAVSAQVVEVAPVFRKTVLMEVNKNNLKTHLPTLFEHIQQYCYMLNRFL